ncbi:MAG: TolC family protein [Bacteroidetes bacterium]|nr:TolC family protein [Bacteroidota bacterium]MBL0137505.1 TolC family protein [Bacteroidota bacterium]
MLKHSIVNQIFPLTRTTGLWIVLAFLPLQLFSQSLNLDSCQHLASVNYPLSKQAELLSKSREYSLDNLNKGYWPQLNIGGQATYQSDVTEIPVRLPGLSIPAVPKDQFKIYGELNQPITDLITVGKQKEVQRAQSDVQTANLEVELYKLRDRVNQLYFGILMIDAQLKQNELLKNDIQTGLNKINAALANGTEYKSNADKLKAELLRANQKTIELNAARKAYLEMLSQFTHTSMPDNTVLETPTQQTIVAGINRPEISYFSSRDKSFDAQKKLLTARNLPKFGLFFQGGWGQPSPVNLLSKDLSSYYIAGIRLNWSVSGLYTLHKEKALVELDRKMNDSQKEIFLFNTNSTNTQINAEINKLKSLLNTDDEIVQLRTSIKSRAQVQLENGVITTNDYLKEISAEDQARQNKILHEIQLLLALYTQQYTTGN